MPALVVSAMALAGCASAGWNGPRSDHFDGKRFHSPDPITLGFGDWVKRVFTKHQGPWRRFTPAAPAPCPPPRVEDGRIRVTFVNHGTVLVQMDGVNILTDPTWAERAFPVVGPRRRRPPGLPFEDLPPVDVVLVSHDHQDHMDLPSLRRLAAEHGARILAGLGSAAYLARKGVARAADVDWWQTVQIAPGVFVTAVPSRHMSGRGLFDGDRRLWCGFVVEGPSGAVYAAGDTGAGSHVARIAERFPGVRLALLPIGGGNPAWYMAQQHLSPADAVAVHEALGARTSVPVHHGTFPQSDDAELGPLEELQAALRASARSPRFLALDNGESVEIPAD